MSKLYIVMLIVMSPLVIISFVIASPFYFFYKLTEKVSDSIDQRRAFKKSEQNFSF